MQQLKAPTSSDILLIEDDEDVAIMLIDHLEHSLEASVRHATDSEQAFRRVLERTPDLVVADVLLPGESALSFIRRLGSVASVPVILITGEPTLERAIEALRLGAVDLFAKPFELDHLSRAAAAALEQAARQRRQARRLRCLRQVTARVVRRRRHLQRQLDVVCRDLVLAHRDLARRVTALQIDGGTGRSADPGPASNTTR